MGMWYPHLPLNGSRETNDCWRWGNCVPHSPQICDQYFCRDEENCQWPFMCEKSCAYCREQPTTAPT